MIGIYDVDLWHGTKKVPNLELMQIWSYLKKKNVIARMLTPDNSIDFYKKLFYFKSFVNTKVPLKLSLYSDNIVRYGTGFTKRLKPLSEEVSSLPPDYTPYAPFANKFNNKKIYEML